MYRYAIKVKFWPETSRQKLSGPGWSAYSGADPTRPPGPGGSGTSSILLTNTGTGTENNQIFSSKILIKVVIRV